ncbi:MAG: DUF1318 domain-containing protein [Gemmatimonadetes bacterium]|nr:MAG: DUF1318 domain-containing protein [Gemmatimonadota bacterium]
MWSILCGIFLLFFTSSCSITVKTPELQLTGRKTALERQIQGTYDPVRDGMWLNASFYYREDRSPTPLPFTRISQTKNRVLDAIQNQAFNQDDIAEFKSEGCVGENNQGYLTILDCPLRAETLYQRRLEEIVAEENRDREIIMRRVIETNPELTDADFPEIQTVFANRNRQNAKPGEWIQTDGGQWIQR